MFVAHRNAKARIDALNPGTSSPRPGRRRQQNITLGGTTLELNYVGKNHSDSTLVMRLRERRSSSPSIGFRSRASSSAAWPTPMCRTSRKG